MTDQARAIKAYNGLHENIDRMGKTLLEYMRHPDVTPEQAEAARQKYLTCYQSWIAARIDLRKRYPPKTGVFQRPLPWN